MLCIIKLLFLIFDKINHVFYLTATNFIGYYLLFEISQHLLLFATSYHHEMPNLGPEQQYELYIAVRDGNIAVVTQILGLGAGSSENDAAACNSRPFEALWHEPGPEATVLHLAACCIQADLVAFLLDHGADPALTAAGKSTVEQLEAYPLFEPARITRPGDVQRIREMLLSKMP